MSSGSGELAVGAGDLKKVSGHIDEARAGFNKLSQQLDSQIQSVRGKWQGDGGRAFQILHEAWTTQHKRIADALDGLSQGLLDTDRDNVSTDQDISSTLQRSTTNFDRMGPRS